MVRKFILIFTVFLISFCASAKEFPHSYWETTINAIIKVESQGNTKVVNGDCAGPMQISKILVKQCNTILKRKKSSKRFSLSDRFNINKSKEMFYLIQETYNPDGNIEKAIRSWNGGINYSVSKTNRYLKKVMKEM